jgi:hypothetical protein
LVGAGGVHTVIIGLDASPLRIGYAVMILQTGELLTSGTMHVANTGDDLRNRQAGWRHIMAEVNRVTDSSLVVCVGLEEAYVRFKRQAILGALLFIGLYPIVSATGHSSDSLEHMCRYCSRSLTPASVESPNYRKYAPDRKVDILHLAS